MVGIVTPNGGLGLAAPVVRYDNGRVRARCLAKHPAYRIGLLKQLMATTPHGKSSYVGDDLAGLNSTIGVALPIFLNELIVALLLFH